jgi:hypothetical protein
MMTYGPGKRIAGDDGLKPYVDWVLYQLEAGRDLYEALYVNGCLVYPSPDGWWRHDWPEFSRHWSGSPDQVKVTEPTLLRARACHRPGWPLLPQQEGILWTPTSSNRSSSRPRTFGPSRSAGSGLDVSRSPR